MCRQSSRPRGAAVHNVAQSRGTSIRVPLLKSEFPREEMSELEFLRNKNADLEKVGQSDVFIFSYIIVKRFAYEGGASPARHKPTSSCHLDRAQDSFGG